MHSQVTAKTTGTQEPFRRHLWKIQVLLVSGTDDQMETHSGFGASWRPDFRFHVALKYIDQ